MRIATNGILIKTSDYNTPTSLLTKIQHHQPLLFVLSLSCEKLYHLYNPPVTPFPEKYQKQHNLVNQKCERSNLHTKQSLTNVYHLHLDLL